MSTTSCLFCSPRPIGNGPIANSHTGRASDTYKISCSPNFAVLSPPVMSGIERGERELLKWSEILWRKEHLIGGITAQLEKMPKGKRQKASLSHFFPHTKRQD